MKKKTESVVSANSKYEQIKRIALIALFSDDDLMNMLVLKGGNALNLIYEIASRASIDLDFSIKDKIAAHDFNKIEIKIQNTLLSTFKEHNLQVIDFKFSERPKNPNDSHPEFWGGYRIEFKVVDTEVFRQNKGNTDFLRRSAEIIGEEQLKTFSVDISKYEFCESKVKKKFDSLTIYVYSPEMIAIEKLRAICQQIPEYLKSIKGTDSGRAERARDFYDIFTIVKKLNINLINPENLELLKNIFAVKSVSTHLLREIQDFRKFHLLGFDALKFTIPATEKVEAFDFYFEFVVDLAKKITARLDDISSTSG